MLISINIYDEIIAKQKSIQYYGDLNVAYAADYTYQFNWLNTTINSTK